MTKSSVILQVEVILKLIPRLWTCGSFDKTKRCWHWSFLLSLLLLSTTKVEAASNTNPTPAPQVKGEMSRVGEATHLEFRGLNKWTYDLKKTEANKYVLQMPAIDDASMAQIATWSDSLVNQVQIEKNGPDGTYLLTFTVSDPKIESFNYLTDEPSRLIIDFYKQNEPEVAAKNQAPASKSLPTKNKKSAKENSTKDGDGYAKKASGGNRKPAGDERLRVDPVPAENNPTAVVQGLAFDAADPQFLRLAIKDYEIKDDAMIAARKNIYIHFPALKMPVSLLPQLQAHLPEFIIHPRDDRENKEARFLLDLYNRQVSKTDRTKDRIGSFFKVYEHFNQTYPDSEYDEIIKNLAAHMYFLRWIKENDPIDYKKSQDAYKYLLSKYPQSPLAERIQQWLAYSELERGNGLGTIQEFQEYLRRYPETAIRDKVHLALAEGNLILNKYNEARQIYQNMQKNALDPQFRIEATFREGDVAFVQKNWSVAESDYLNALKIYPKQAVNYPNASYNLAESLFWQRKYKSALQAYIGFLTQHPDHPYGGYAMTRAGELLEAMGADRSRVIGAFLESYFRYRNNPGAEVARIRLLSQQMKGMKEKELKKAMEEIDEIAKHSSLPMINEFVVLMQTDGLQHREEYEQALKSLISYYQSHPTSNNLELFKARILRNISEVISKKIIKSDFIGALQMQAQYAKTWLKNSDRLDLQYFSARAYEQAGAFSEARTIYEKILSKRKSILGSEEEKERRVSELLPSVQSLRLRLAAMAVQERQYPAAYEQLKYLGDAKNISAEENNERVQLMAKVLRERGQLDQARQYLKESIAAWRGEPAQISASLLDLADLEMKTNNAEAAEKVVDKIIDLRQAKAEISDDFYAKALELKGQALQSQNKDLAAAETYQKLLDDFEGSRPLGSVRFRVGQILFERGDLASAEKVWAKLDAEKYALFRKLANERLENSKWQSENKKYIQRIPAMSSFKEDK